MIVFNEYKNRLITLRKGEEFCKKCKGKGLVSSKGKFHNLPFTKKYHTLICHVCLGDGKIDWIEKITGKPKTKTMDNTGSCTGPCTQSS